MTVFVFGAAALLLAVVALLWWALRRHSANPETTQHDAEIASSNLRLLRQQLAELDAEHAAGTLDAQAYASARAELQRRVLEEADASVVPTQPMGLSRAQHGDTARFKPQSTALALALVVPLVAVALYLKLGNPQAQSAALENAQRQPTPEEVNELVQRLADRLKADPDSPQGWRLLANAYASMQRFDDSRDAFAQALKYQKEPDAQLLADYADVWAMSLGGKLAGEPLKLVQRALVLDANQPKALSLAGTEAMERNDRAAALAFWQRAKAAVPPGSPFAARMDENIAEVGGAALAPAAPLAMAAPAASALAQPPVQGQTQATSGTGLAVTVRLAPTLAKQLQAGDTLFVFARAPEGPRMPLAIVRQPATSGPVQVVLDDTQAMQPQLRLSGFSKVVVGARVSRSGNATPQPGDLEGQTAVIASAGKTEVLIDSVRR
jgi:cytochrome c-type biogenesis protein CcmH